MTQTDDAYAIALMIMILFGGPFLIQLQQAFVTWDRELAIYLGPIGFALVGLCCLIVLIGVWIDQ